MASHPAYDTYWKRKQLLRRSFPSFPVRRWWETDGLCDIEQVYFEAVRGSESLLDVGAGDLRIMAKFQAAGYRGVYHTQDIGGEERYTYGHLSQVSRSYGAVLCLDVLEHLTLEEGLGLVRQVIGLLDPGGVLVLQTANAAYIPDPLSWDMTHIHTYNLPDLWAFLKCEGMEVDGYRVVLGARNPGPVVALKSAITAYVKRRILGCDFANNIAIVSRRPKPAP